MNKNFAAEVFDFFLPRFCGGCGLKLNAGESFLCSDCLTELKSMEINRIEIIALQQNLDLIFSLYKFESGSIVQSLLHSIKYSNKFRTAKYIGGLIGEKFNSFPSAKTFDFALPVPLNKVKQVERGYNQSHYICKGFAELTGIKIKSGILKRVKYTATQTKLNRRERAENIAGAFKAAKPDKIHGKRIIVIDDVITTGATTNECAGALLGAGATKVIAVSLARA